jgi:hypothetical protein
MSAQRPISVIISDQSVAYEIPNLSYSNHNPSGNKPWIIQQPPNPKPDSQSAIFIDAIFCDGEKRL